MLHLLGNTLYRTRYAYLSKPHKEEAVNARFGVRRSENSNFIYSPSHYNNANQA